MQTRVDRRVFERTDFGSFGWLKEGPLTPPYETAFFAATDAQAQSFRSKEREGLPSVRTDFGSFAWIFTAIVVFDPVNFVAIEELAKSFRTDDKPGVDSRLTDFGQFGWLKTGSETPLYDVSFFNAIDALTKSFRTREGEKLLLGYHLNTPVFATWFQGDTGPTIVAQLKFTSVQISQSKLVDIEI